MTGSLPVRSDADLVTGPAERFGELFDRHCTALYDYGVRRVGRDLAEDLVSETFLVAFTRRDRYDVTAPSARPWLFGILTNLLRSHRRTEVRGLRAFARVGVDPLGGATRLTEPFADQVDERLDADAAARSLAGALAALPRDQRDVLLLHVWAGMNYAEIAAALGVPPGTVRSRLHRAKERLRRALPGHFAPSR